MDASSGSIVHSDRRSQRAGDLALDHAEERSHRTLPIGPVEPEGRPPRQRERAASRGARWELAIVVGLLQVFVGLMGIWGGIMLLTDAWALPQEWLRHSPFSGWHLPGLALLVFVGVGCSVAGVITVANLRASRLLSTAAGAGLCAWIVVQIAWLRIVHPVMQPVIFGIGVAIFVLARRLSPSR
jgi:hypothetical protein